MSAPDQIRETLRVGDMEFDFMTDGGLIIRAGGHQAEIPGTQDPQTRSQPLPSLMRESEITALPPHLTPEEILREHIDRVEEIRFEHVLGDAMTVTVFRLRIEAEGR